MILLVVRFIRKLFFVSSTTGFVTSVIARRSLGYALIYGIHAIGTLFLNLYKR